MVRDLSEVTGWGKAQPGTEPWPESELLATTRENQMSLGCQGR